MVHVGICLIETNLAYGTFKIYHGQYFKCTIGNPYPQKQIIKCSSSLLYSRAYSFYLWYLVL